MINAHKNMLGIINKIQLSIGDLSDGIGVSQRRLRYWEEESYIEPIAGNKKGARRYSFFIVGRCAQIKEFLNEGYTLTKAYEETIEDEQKKKVFRDSIFNQGGNFTINVIDKEHSYGKINLGAKCESKELFGVADKNSVRYELR